MGRESRRERDPNALTPYGEAAAMAVAKKTIVILLSRDLRIVQWSRDWVDRTTERFATESPTREVALQRIFEFFADGSGMSDADFASLETVLRDMGVPWTDVPALLTVLLRREICNALDPGGAALRKLNFVVGGLTDHPSGRMPRHSGAEIERNVNWWYRHRIKAPTDSIATLTKEYKENEKRITEAHSVVQNGLSRAEFLLNAEIRKRQVTK